MASFTMELREVLELEGDPGYVPGFDFDRDFDASIAGAGKTVGLASFPIFDDSHRSVLLEKIVERYWTREIGQETISLFRFQMRRRMNEIMPYYNQLYLSTLIAFDPLATFNLETIRNDSAKEENTRTSQSTSGSDSTSVSRAVNTDTPQNELPDDWMEDATYATTGALSGSKTDGTANSTGTDGSTGTTEANGSTTVKGFQGSAADLLGKYRAQIINIDIMILDALSTLFHGLWDSGDEMLPSRSLYGYGFGY